MNECSNGACNGPGSVLTQRVVKGQGGAVARETLPAVDARLEAWRDQGQAKNCRKES